MKIVFTSFTYPPETSGVAIVVQYLAEGLAKRGHQVKVITRLNGNDFPLEESVNGVQIIRFNMGQDLFKRNIGECNKYIDYIRTLECDILILECLQCHTTDILLPYLKDLRCRKIIHAHGAPGILMNPFEWEGDILHTIGHVHNWMRWKKYYAKTFPKYSKNIDAAISLSLCASDLDFFARHIKNVYIAENSSNDIFFNEDLYTLSTETILKMSSKRYILNISNYSDRKNQILLMKSFAEANLKDCALVLVGSKPNEYYQKVCRYAEKLSKEKGLEIILLHNIERKYFPSLIKNADLFAMTSKWEEYPVSLVEAMSVGTAFLSTPVGNAHILPGGVTSRYDGEIPGLLRTLMSNPSILKRLGEQGKMYALQNNTLDTVLNNYESILTKVLD